VRKKTILGTLVIIGALIISCIPTVVSDPAPLPPTPPSGSTCWVVTDDVVTPDKLEHYFYDEKAGEIVDDHTQEWYIDPIRDPHPISDDGYYINTEISCWAVSSGNNSILYMNTHKLDPEGQEYSADEVIWTIINGNIGPGYYTVRVVWDAYGNPGNDETEDISIDGDTVDIELGHMQDLWMELTYGDDTFSPGQKYYWIETDYPAFEGKDYLNVTLSPPGEYQGQPYIASSESGHDLTWWTDYNCEPVPIWQHDPPWHINTKALVWVEESGNDLIVFVKVYGESNYYPETINWTVTDAKNAPDPYFNVQIDTEASDLNVNVTLGGNSEFKELGSIGDPMDLDIVFYKQ
jgi:hypothetical protein